MNDATVRRAAPEVPRALAEALIIVLVACAIGIGANWTRRAPLTLGGPVPVTPESCLAPLVADAPPVPFITLRLAAKRHGKPGVLFLDARPRAEFNVAHIAGALSMPADDPAAGHAATAAILTAQLVVVYCDRPQCGLSTRVAQRLRSEGAADIRVLAEGWLAWNEAGYPAESGGH